MADKATIVEEQIALLDSRGMKIEDKDKAKENLLDMGYYRLEFYWFPFEKTYPRNRLWLRGISIGRANPPLYLRYLPTHLYRRLTARRYTPKQSS